MFLQWVCLMALIFFIPASWFIFGLLDAIKYTLNDDQKNRDKSAWRSIIGFIGCLLIISYILLS